MTEIAQYKKSIIAACDLYKKEVKNKHSSLHPERVKDLTIFQELIMNINDKPLLDLKLKEHLSQMSTRGRIWTLYLFSSDQSRLKSLIQSILDYYESEIETEHLKKTIQFYEAELDKRASIHTEQLREMQKDHEILISVQEKSYQEQIDHLKSHIDLLMNENISLKAMIEKQSEIIKNQFSQLVEISMTQIDKRNMSANKDALKEELNVIKQVSVFHADCKN